MPAKVAIRRRTASRVSKKTGIRAYSQAAIFQIEKMMKDQWKDIWSQHIEDLEDLAADIEYEAKRLAPVYMDNTNPMIEKYALKRSIEVNVSRSHRYPGLMASASATNRDSNYDYALIQEERTDFVHEHGEAHYLSQPFYNNIAAYLSEYGEDYSLTEGLLAYGLEE